MAATTRMVTSAQRVSELNIAQPTPCATVHQMKNALMSRMRTAPKAAPDKYPVTLGIGYHRLLFVS